ncbi:MAG: signal peptidase II [Puniceicoccales bacterium]|jgi:signal peptidase II|nr:signal peptidase II [Puniceicoccales bacterium]
MIRFRRYIPFWTILFTLLALDQVTKLATLAWIPSSYENPPIEVIPGFFNLVHVYNKGAAFSMFSGHRWPLVILALGALIGIFFWRRSLELERPIVQWAFGLLTGGIIGNVIDRVFYGHVVDFLDFNIPLYGHWPAFNIADSGICIGVGLYVVYSFMRPVKKEKKPEEAAA